MLKKNFPLIMLGVILVGYVLFDQLMIAREANDTPGLQIVIVPSEIVVGKNRFAVGLLSKERGMIHDARVRFDYLNGSTVELVAEATRITTADGNTTIYVHEREFARAGDSLVQVTVQTSDGATMVKQIPFKVLANSSTLKVGMRAPALHTRTASDVGGELWQLSSAFKPNPAFYRLPLAQAITNDKPTLVLFVTPAFCQSRFCAPLYDIADALENKFGARVNFVHVEAYASIPNPANAPGQFDPALRAFGLATEPWVYVIDQYGVIAFRVEGVTTESELSQQLDLLLK